VHADSFRRRSHVYPHYAKYFPISIISKHQYTLFQTPQGKHACTPQACTLTRMKLTRCVISPSHFSSYIQMKFFSAPTLGLTLTLLACTAWAACEPTEAIDPATLADELEKLGADSEFSMFSLPKVYEKSIIAADKLTLAPLPVVEGTPNEDARAIFSWVASNTHIVWKLSLFDIEDFTGAHLHLVQNTPDGPIVQHLVPERSEGDFIAPVDIAKGRVYVGSFGISELNDTLGVTSIREFITEYISKNYIYINVHGPENAAILRGFLNA